MESTQRAIPWRERPLQPIRAASEIAGISSATIYRLAARGALTLKRLGGRTLVETSGLIALIDAAEDWAPPKRPVGTRRPEPHDGGQR